MYPKSIKSLSYTFLLSLVVLIALFAISPMATQAAPPCSEDENCVEDLTTDPNNQELISNTNLSTSSICERCLKLETELELETIHYLNTQYLLVSSGLTDSVLRFDAKTGAFVDIFASGSGLDGPSGLKIGPDGNLYVNSTRNDSVLRYDGGSGAFIDTFVTAGSGGLDAPGFITFTPWNGLTLSVDLETETEPTKTP